MESENTHTSDDKPKEDENYVVKIETAEEYEEQVEDVFNEEMKVDIKEEDLQFEEDSYLTRYQTAHTKKENDPNAVQTQEQDEPHPNSAEHLHQNPTSQHGHRWHEPVVEISPPGEASQEGGGTLPNPVVPSLSPDPDSVPGLQQARANSAKARNEHRAALLEEIRDQGTSFKEMVSSALASTHVKEDPPALQYWKEVLNPIANDCVAIGERYRSDLLAEIAALITRWKRLAATGVEAAPPEFMVNMIASVGGARQPPTAPPIQQPAMEAVPLGVMGMVPGATPMLHIPSDTNVFRPQQQVVQQPKVLHRPLSSSTPYETNNTSLQSFGIPASFVVDNLPSFSVNTPTSQSAPPTTLHTTSNTVNTPNK